MPCPTLPIRVLDLPQPWEMSKTCQDHRLFVSRLIFTRPSLPWREKEVGGLLQER